MPRSSSRFLRRLSLCAVLLALVFLLFHEISLLPDGKLHVYFLDVDQGDAILLVSPSGKQVLIDGGPNTTVLEHVGKYLSFFDRTIELLILTHPDADHVTGAPEILSRYRIERVLFPGTQHSSGRYEAFLSYLEEQGVTIIEPDPSIDIDLGDGLVLDIVWPTPEVFGTKPKNANNPSVVVRALFGDTSILLTGDIEKEAETSILAMGTDIRSTILKVAHHGSKTSSSTGFLLAAQPELAIISVGRDNHFGHPHPDVIERYRQMGIPVRTTAEEGTISLVF